METGFFLIPLPPYQPPTIMPPLVASHHNGSDARRLFANCYLIFRSIPITDREQPLV
jgi:hypothetical protein